MGNHFINFANPTINKTVIAKKINNEAKVGITSKTVEIFAHCEIDEILDSGKRMIATEMTIITKTKIASGKYI